MQLGCSLEHIMYLGGIVKWVKNHVGLLKNYQLFQTYLCNATLMSCGSKKFVLNDLYECWRIQKKIILI
jgi:hypothetical protein